MQKDEATGLRVARLLGEGVMALWDDPAVRELYVNPDGRVWVDRGGVGRQSTGLVLHEVSVTRFLSVVAAFVGETLTPETPVLQGAMPHARFLGARLQGAIPPRDSGPRFNLRKHAPLVYPLESYLSRDTLTFEQYDLLLECVDSRRNILVVGGTVTGKTTFLNALIRAMTERWPTHRFLLAEDTPELQCAAEDFCSLRTLPGEPMGPAINREAMRMSPDRIICGEFRDKAAYYCADLWTTGHNGGAASMHANSVEGALRRMNRLALDGTRGSHAELIAEAVDVVVVLTKAEVGGRVSDLALVDGLDRRGRFRLSRPVAGAQLTGVGS